MSQHTIPGEARACFASVESGEQDAKAGPQCLDIPGAGPVYKAAGENRAGEQPLPVLCWLGSVTSQSQA